MEGKRGSNVSASSVISFGGQQKELTNRACVIIFCGVILTLAGMLLTLLTSLGFRTFVKYPVWSLVAWIVITAVGVVQITFGILLLKKETRILRNNWRPRLPGLVTPVNLP
ncbi:hypothetical protein RvY_17438-1 [Ramazzottius varieornatus]|uniref:Uncharacterized protein n=1 Tax=Ramazzottius varieornatus TaxID=947166 RepID=A0A1D1W244_RAMVA|nr:hypothetical protein RvY_17438-1 [Ramazzottius varieornatus]